MTVETSDVLLTPLIFAVAWLGPALSGLAALPFGGKGGGDDPGKMLKELLAQIPQLKMGLDLSMRQAMRQDPLHGAVTQLAMNLLPRTSLGPLKDRPNLIDYTSPSYGSWTGKPTIPGGNPGGNPGGGPGGGGGGGNSGGDGGGRTGGSPGGDNDNPSFFKPYWK